MHQIQAEILYTLAQRSPRRYSELKPKKLEGNVFMYHLSKVMKEGYIEKQGPEYALTKQGLLYADTLSKETKRPRAQPKIVTQIALQNNKGEWLLYRRPKEPFYGKVGFPYGKIHLGESILDSAKREIKEKAGIEAELTHRGEVYITVQNEGEIVSQMLCHVFSGNSNTAEVYEHCFWTKKVSPEEEFPGFSEEVRLLEMSHSGRFFAELVF